MTPRTSEHPGNRRARRLRVKAGGFTLMEALITLAIMAVLMAALGTAFSASMTSFKENQRIATASQTARGVLQRMMGDIRTCAAVDANSASITILPPDANIVQQIQYRYDPTNKRLSYIRKINGTNYTYTACGEDGSLKAFTVTTTTGQDWQGITCIKNVRVAMTLQFGPQTFQVTASASPRRNQVF
jgi:prepilin-type N-terminal cleavage/methylation domain-containing protein